MLQRHQLKKAAGVVGGLWQYYTGKEISTEARRSLFELHCETNGVFTDSVAKIVRRVRPPRKTVPTKGILGYLSVYDQNNIADFIGKHGTTVSAQKSRPIFATRSRNTPFRRPAASRGVIEKIEFFSIPTSRRFPRPTASRKASASPTHRSRS